MVVLKNASVACTMDAVVIHTEKYELKDKDGKPYWESGGDDVKEDGLGITGEFSRTLKLERRIDSSNATLLFSNDIVKGYNLPYLVEEARKLG